MRLRWPVVAAVLGGVLVAPLLGMASAVLTVPFTYDTLRPFELIAFWIFTVLTVPIALLVAWSSTPLLRAFAVGLLIGWAAVGIWLWMGAPGAERSP